MTATGDRDVRPSARQWHNVSVVSYMLHHTRPRCIHGIEKPPSAGFEPKGIKTGHVVAARGGETSNRASIIVSSPQISSVPPITGLPSCPFFDTACADTTVSDKRRRLHAIRHDAATTLLPSTARPHCTGTPRSALGTSRRRHENSNGSSAHTKYLTTTSI